MGSHLLHTLDTDVNPFSVNVRKVQDLFSLVRTSRIGTYYFRCVGGILTRCDKVVVASWMHNCSSHALERSIHPSVHYIHDQRMALKKQVGCNDINADLWQLYGHNLHACK